MWIIKRYDYIMASTDLMLACPSLVTANNVLKMLREADKNAAKYKSPQEVWVGSKKFIVQNGFSYSWEYVDRAEA